MEVCFTNGKIGNILTLIEVILCLILLLLYLKNIKNIYSYHLNDNYETIDLVLAYISCLLLGLIIMGFFLNYFFISLFITISKYSISFICLFLLLANLLWNYKIILKLITRFFKYFLIIFDIIFCILGFYYTSPFYNTYCKTFIEILLIGINICLSSAIFFLFYFNNKKHLFDNKNDIENLKDDYFNITETYQYLDMNIKNVMNTYFKISILFFIGFCIDLFFYLKSNNNQNICIYYGNYNNQNFGFLKFILCFTLFILRDIIPTAFIYFTLFIYKPMGLSKSSSFIEEL